MINNCFHGNLSFRKLSGFGLMKAFFIKVLFGLAERIEWLLNHREHYVSWRKAGVFMLTLSTLAFMQVSLVIIPVEKEGKFNLFETERIEQVDINDISKHECKLESEAYTQCSMAKYHMNNVDAMLPLFTGAAKWSLFVGAVFVFLSFFGGIESKSLEFREWKKLNNSNSTDSTNSNETNESENETPRQISSDN